MEMRSAWPSARTCSATAGSWMRFEATTGTSTLIRSRSVRGVNAARGTEVTMVGTRDSCQPMPVDSTSTPRSVRPRASTMVSTQS